MSIEEKKQRMDSLHEQLTSITKEIACTQTVLDQLNHQHWKFKMEFQALDRELSLIDGRHRIVGIRQAREKKAMQENAQPLKFTQEQVEAIAAALGVDISFQ